MWKSVSSLEFPIKFDERFKVNLVLLFITHFKIISHLKYYIELFYVNIIVSTKTFRETKRVN